MNELMSEHAIRFWAIVGLQLTGVLIGIVIIKIVEWFWGRR
jgi:hypothetical protein